MPTPRKRYRAEFKARVALEALKGHKPVNAFARTYGGHPTPITPWKHQLEKAVLPLFSARRAKGAQAHEALHAQWYQQLGPLKVE
jgi:transposase-like protein